MTKEEASKKLCPFMTYVANESQSFNANFAVNYNSTCRTTDCMAWEETSFTAGHGFCKLLPRARTSERRIL